MPKLGPSPEPNRPLPAGYVLKWGHDSVTVFDAKWIEAIASELAGSQPEPGYLSAERYSALQERAALQMAAFLGQGAGLRSTGGKGAKGITKPSQLPVATAALKSLLDIELPAAINIRGYSRSEARFTALQVRLDTAYDQSSSLPELTWAFQGYQLYSSGHVGGALSNPQACDYDSVIEVRRLDGSWQPVSFEGVRIDCDETHTFHRNRHFVVSEDGNLKLDDKLLRKVSL